MKNKEYLEYVRLMTRPNIHPEEERFDELLRRTAGRTPHRVALVYRGINFTFETLESLTNAMARTLKEDLGIKRNDVVALTSMLCPESIILYLSILRAGAIVTPVNPLHIDRDMEYQLKESGACMAIVSPPKYDIANKIRKQLNTLEQVWWYGEPSADLDNGKNIFLRARNTSTKKFEPDEIAGDSVAALPFSSGTTGLPKGVMLTHGNLVANAYHFVNTHMLSDLEVIFNGLPLLINLHIGGVIASGAKQILLDKWDLKYMLELARKYEATSLYTVVPMVNEMSSLPDLESYGFPSLKFIAAGASYMSPSVSGKVAQRLGINVVQGFGSQETSTMTHALPVPLFDGMSIPIGSCGIPASDTDYRIVNLLDKRKDVDVGEPGELVIKGPQIMKGYWKDSKKTRSVLRQGWYYTGDVVRQDENGVIFFVDREKDVIKSGGHTISPVELENILKEISEVKDCAVVGIPVGEDDEIPVGYIVTNGNKIKLEKVMAYVNKNIASYKHLREIFVIDEIPKSAGGRTGKVQRQVLRKRYIEDRK